MDWSPVFRCGAADKAWSNFKSLFLAAVDESAPEKSVRFKVRSKPWMNAEILTVIKARNDSFNKFCKNGDEYTYSEFKSLRNEVTTLIKIAKKEYFNKKISENKSNPQQL